jgi:hypothetical protein
VIERGQSISVCRCPDITTIVTEDDFERLLSSPHYYRSVRFRFHLRWRREMASLFRTILTSSAQCKHRLCTALQTLSALFFQFKAFELLKQEKKLPRSNLRIRTDMLVVSYS